MSDDKKDIEESKDDNKDDSKDDNKDDSKDDSKDDNKVAAEQKEDEAAGGDKLPFKWPLPEKEWPGDHTDKLEDLEKNKPPHQKIRFEWDPGMKQKYEVDTFHMLYLIQLAYEGTIERIGERNMWFRDTKKRPDRYQPFFDGIRVVTNILEWHYQDREKNIFDGRMLDSEWKTDIINKYFHQIGGMKKGPATKLWKQLTMRVEIKHYNWCQTVPSPKLELRTYGHTEYRGLRKELKDCTTEDLVALLYFKNEGSDSRIGKGPFGELKEDDILLEDITHLGVPEEKWDKDPLRTVWNSVDKIREYFRDHHITGREFVKDGGQKEMLKGIVALIGYQKLTKDIRRYLSYIQKCKVQDCLDQWNVQQIEEEKRRLRNGGRVFPEDLLKNNDDNKDDEKDDQKDDEKEEMKEEVKEQEEKPEVKEEEKEDEQTQEVDIE